LFTRNETYTMAATNKQPTRYFSQQDKMRIGSSKYHISEILGSKIGYTNIARYTYVSLAEKDGVRLICVTMRSEMKTDKYADVATLLDYAFSTWTGSTAIEADNVQQAVTVYGGGDALGQVTVSDPGISLLLADGLSAADISVELEVPERWVLGTECEAYAVYTLNGRGLQENTSVRVAAKVEGLEELFAAVDSTALDTADDVAPHKKHSVMIWIFGGVGVLLVLLLIVYILLERRRRRIIRARRAARRARIYGTTPQRQRSRSTSNERNMNRSAHDRQQSNRKQKTTRK
jgi:D-alanyl-D-alanine carboxypeptidase (penicillin-binding protein 5/6)